MKCPRRPHPDTVPGNRFKRDDKGNRASESPMNNGQHKGEGRTGETEEKRRREACHGNARSCKSHG